MSQTQGDVAIVNQALGKVGGTRILGFDDETESANLAKDLYVPTRDAVLEDADWSFARIRHRLTPLAAKPLGFEYAYVIPESVLIVREVYLNESSTEQLVGWDVEINEAGEHIIVANPAGNEPAIFTRSTKKTTDPSRFSSLFASALAARLAAEFAIPIAQSRRLKADMWQEYQWKLPSATSADGQQGRTKAVKASTIINARGRGGSGPFVYGPPVG